MLGKLTGGITNTFIAKSSVALNLVLIGIIVLMMVSNSATTKRLNNTIKEKDAALAEVNRTLGICRANNTTYRTAVERQNRSIEAMAALAKQQEANGATALAAIRKSNEPLTIRVDQISRSKASGDLCVSADNLIKEAVK